MMTEMAYAWETSEMTELFEAVLQLKTLPELEAFMGRSGGPTYSFSSARLYNQRQITRTGP